MEEVKHHVMIVGAYLLFNGTCGNHDSASESWCISKLFMSQDNNLRARPLVFPVAGLPQPAYRGLNNRFS
jgi:hypothetical protein